jgi:hypothetical protein
VREVSGKAQRAPLGSGEALPGTQEGRLIRPRRRREEFRDGHKKPVAKLPRLKDKLRGCADRRAANVPMGNEEPI